MRGLRTGAAVAAVAALAPSGALVGQGLPPQELFALEVPTLQDANGAARRAAPIALSLAIPGTGQLLLGRTRGWAYLALEAVGWAFYVERRAAGGDARDAYRDLAWERARIQVGARGDGPFSYYETMSNWARSGAFDADGAAQGIQPEMDAATYNGSIWIRAVGLFGAADAMPGDARYAQALAYYQERAYPGDRLWDWTGDDPALNEFRDLISESDRRYRHATNVLGAVIANHVVSAVDAYLASRGPRSPLRLRLEPGTAPGRFDAAILVRWTP